MPVWVWMGLFLCGEGRPPANPLMSLRAMNGAPALVALRARCGGVLGCGCAFARNDKVAAQMTKFWRLTKKTDAKKTDAKVAARFWR